MKYTMAFLIVVILALLYYGIVYDITPKRHFIEECRNGGKGAVPIQTMDGEMLCVLESGVLFRDK